ncbi:hypothetical protein [Entomobacter blattae]|uniref:hypothetical protein n=1 Tax=Entomobacter blattae TaxID=2762277 RepID=UPI00193C70BF|nr:hypothetical protein [Entomobacter blattae]
MQDVDTETLGYKEESFFRYINSEIVALFYRGYPSKGKLKRISNTELHITLSCTSLVMLANSYGNIKIKYFFPKNCPEKEDNPDDVVVYCLS